MPPTCSKVIMFLIWLLIFSFVKIPCCNGQNYVFKDPNTGVAAPLPFPACRAIDVDCQRRGLRTFFFLMDAGHLGMRPVDPTVLNSVTVTYPNQGLTIMLRRVNVTGARWTKLVDRKFNLQGNRSGVKFHSDLHVTADIIMKIAERYEPFAAFITMDIAEVESNITYTWNGIRGIDSEDYLVIGQERIAVRNSRTPTFFMQPDTADASMIDQTLQMSPTILDQISIEIVTALMHYVVDNFRFFATSIPVKYYYQYY